MADTALQRYIEAELGAIRRFCRDEHRHQAAPVCRRISCRDCVFSNEITLRWVDTGRAAEFDKMYEGKHDGTADDRSP